MVCLLVLFMETYKKFGAELLNIASNYYGGTIDIVENLPYSMWNTVVMIEFYSLSKFLNGNRDELGREKPFYNIVNANVDVSASATDIDTSDIDPTTENPTKYVHTMLLGHELQKWMKEQHFGVFLNDLRDTRPRYGGVLVKKVEKGKELEVSVCQWKNIIADPVDILGGVLIEKFWMTPSQLSKKKDVWENVDEALKFADERGDTEENTNQYSTVNQVEIWDVYGEFENMYLDEYEGKENDYSLQHHIVAVNGTSSVRLLCESAKEKPYKYLAWKKRPGRSLGLGVVEEGEEAQVWTNDMAIKQHTAAEWASKVFAFTDSNTFINNMLTDVDNGHIFKIEKNSSMSPMNLSNRSFPQFQALIEQWNQQYQQATSTYGAVRGETPPSNTPFRLQALITQQASTQFDDRAEEAGLFVEEILKDWTLPHLVKNLTQGHILASDFTKEQLDIIDHSFAEHEAYTMFVDAVLSGELKGSDISPETYLQMQEQFMEVVRTKDARRYVKVPKGYFKGIESDISFNITGESSKKQAMLESLANILTMVAQNPAILQNPGLRRIFAQIVETAGIPISPTELEEMGQMATEQPIAPQGAVQDPLQALTKTNEAENIV